MDGYKAIATTGDIERKTEKAVLVRVVTSCGTEPKVWFPLSQVQITKGYVWAKDWIIEAKGREVAPIITIDPRMIMVAA